MQRSGSLRSATGERRLNLALEAADAPIPIPELLDGTHRAARFYRGRSARTLSRDLDYLIAAGLIVSAAGVIEANLEILRPPMRRTPSAEGAHSNTMTPRPFSPRARSA